MSLVFIIAPVIAASPLFAAAVASVAGAMGFRLVKERQVVDSEVSCNVQIEVDDNYLLEEFLEKEGNLVLQKEGVTISFNKDIRGHCKVDVCGRNKTKQELDEIGREVLNKVLQQYSYNKVKTEMGNKGFSVVNEETLADGTIKIQVRKWS